MGGRGGRRGEGEGREERWGGRGGRRGEGEGREER